MSKTPAALAPYKDGAFHRISKIVGISDDVFFEVADRIPMWPEGMSLLRQILQTTGKSQNLFFCLEDYVILQYGSYISISHSPLHNERVGQRIKGKNEIVDPCASLNAADLRKIFVMIEALVFKCVHLNLESQSENYCERTQAYETRICRLHDANFINDATKQLAEELYQVRCQFAHSIRSVHNISYLSKSLEERWGSSNSSHSNHLKRQFLPDVFRFSEVLLKIFKSVQQNQIDATRFLTAIQNI